MQPDDHEREEDISVQDAGPRIKFESPNNRLQYENRSRSMSRGRVRRDSISSIRSRAQSTSGLPIGFRTLSFQVSDSQTNRFDKAKEKTPQKEEQDHEYFEGLEFHTLSIDEVCQRFNVLAHQGLSNAAAARRLERDGRNSIPQRRENYMKKVFWYIFGGFCSVLWIGVIVFFVCWRPLGNPPQPYNLGLAILVLIVIFLQACFSAFQDWSTKRTMNSILDLLPSEALVLRESQQVKVSATDLVAGDIVRITIGNKVPADVRLLTTSDDLRFDRSILTGESDEIEGAVNSTDENFLETRNIALMGTIVTNGSGTGVVVLTGGRSVMGRIAKAASSVKDKPTLIQKEITRFVRIIVCLTVCLACLILFTWVGWLRRDHFSFMNVVAMLNDVMGCVVAFIPEGMPIGVALTLMIIARRMKQANILPKGLSTVETLGCVNVICSDKTGTLTSNRMDVTTVAFIDEQFSATEALDALNQPSSRDALKRLHNASMLCNDASFDPPSLELPIMEREVQGNATDGAVLKFAEMAKANNPLEKPEPRVFEIPFNSKNKWMLTIHPSNTEKSQYLILVKGAPEVLLPHCTRYWSNREKRILPLDESSIQKLSEIQGSLSRNAERVIILCERYYTPSAAPGTNDFADEISEGALEDLIIIGIMGIMDPPRPETAETVASCRRAGVRFFMVTGDFGLTACAIARKVGIFSGHTEPDTYHTIAHRNISESPSKQDGTEQMFLERSCTSLLLEGPQISKLTSGEWENVCKYEEIVFARTTPEQKLRIVNELRKAGNAVAVTGDGVNDAPALRAADVGIAVASGSDVALEAADLVLLDKFDSIVTAIRLGRLVFQNLQKVVGYLLPAGSWSEIWPVIMNVFFGVPLPLSSFLMIIICVFTDLFLSLSMVMEKEEFDLLSLPPRDHKTDHLITLRLYSQSYLFIGVMETVCAHSMFFYYMYKHAGIPFHALVFAFERYSDGFYGHTEEELTYYNTVGQCVYFVTLVILQWGNILSIRNKRLSILQADPIRKQRRNPWILLGIVSSLVMAIFVTEEPGIQSLFGTESVPLEFWFLPLPLALGILMMDEFRKLSVRVFPKGPTAWIAW